MAHRWLAWLAVVVLLAAPATAWAQAAVSAQEMEQRFALFDTDRDGKISQNEFEINKVTALFEHRGRTASGTIDRQIQITRAESRMNQASFQAFDMNGDGMLSAAEIVGAPQLQFEAIDKNGDGFIDRQEFEALVNALFN
jgi:Ca2+-binding EF-hand superfamily protein